MSWFTLGLAISFGPALLVALWIVSVLVRDARDARRERDAETVRLLYQLTNEGAALLLAERSKERAS